MRIGDDALKSVIFIGFGIDNWVGTGFLVSRESDKFSGKNFIYLVTARHVIAKIGDRDFIIRINTNNGKSFFFQVSSEIKWFFHPKEDESSDIAVYPLVIDKDVFNELNYAALSTKMFVSDASIQSDNIGVGDDVFMTGLFGRHSGKEKNLPIVRMGNIAMIPSEPIKTRDFGDMEAYLIESHSIGGLSGSPVFVLKQYEIGRWRSHLLGLVHGHWRIDQDKIIDSSIEDSIGLNMMNVGITAVVPAKKILETIEQGKLSEVRVKMEETWIAKNSPTPD
jgi:hypothetical protein